MEKRCKNFHKKNPNNLNNNNNNEDEDEDETNSELDNKFPDITIDPSKLNLPEVMVETYEKAVSNLIFTLIINHKLDRRRKTKLHNNMAYNKRS